LRKFGNKSTGRWRITMRRSAVTAVAAVGDSLPPALLFPFKSKRFKKGFRGGFGVSRNFTSSFLVPSSNLGFRRQEQQQQESRKGPTFLASSFRKSLLMYRCCQVNPELEQTTERLWIKTHPREGYLLQFLLKNPEQGTQS
jgi:hypothetical protein